MEACTDDSSLHFKQRAVVEFLTAEKVAPIEIHRRLKAVYGNDCIDVSTVRRWANRCANSEPGRANLRDANRSGRPLTVTNESDKAKVDELIKHDRRVTQRTIAIELGISQERVGHMINELGYRKVCARWVPRSLTTEMKASRLEICQRLLLQYENEGEEFLYSIVTADETWVHHYEPETKRQSMEYHHKDSPAKKKFKALPSVGKIMATVFWDAEGVIHVEFLEPGTTINSERYIRTLKNLKKRLTRVRKHKRNILLQHDNARPHTAHATVEAIHNLNFTVLPHPAYSPDLAPCDYHLFPKMKESLRGKRYDSNDDVMNTVRTWLRKQSVEFYCDGIQKLVHRWRKCVAVRGTYVEK